ncbi:uncharacterized protein LOC143264486 [Megachile rotundata]|uniref:uncharacterized protein LOC143264486 n=1 Tax=Megachile rotundata TaxID=143995 RepID=UPI003FD42434
MQLLGTFLVSESMNYSWSRGTLTSAKRNRIEDDRDVKAKEMQLRGETGGGRRGDEPRNVRYLKKRCSRKMLTSRRQEARSIQSMKRPSDAEECCRL